MERLSRRSTSGRRKKSKPPAKVSTALSSVRSNAFSILPYSLIVGQSRLRLALELAFIDPGIGGVLLSGHRGTAKSTAVRAFAQMMYGGLPVTLPINATEDRVIGGWKIEDLMRGKASPQRGLLEEANGKLLYIDEVNLLDDHITNLILDVASTGVLEVQREGQSRKKKVSFTLVGTMNPEEGGLRPQLLDRFGFMVEVEGENQQADRLAILTTVLDFDDALRQPKPPRFLTEAEEKVRQRKAVLLEAQGKLPGTRLTDKTRECCAYLAEKLEVEGHRAERVMALAARAHAALILAEGKDPSRQTQETTVVDVQQVARLALQHRRRNAQQSDRMSWGPADGVIIESLKPFPMEPVDPPE
jgi:magnesium chelatase subunit I